MAKVRAGHDGARTDLVKQLQKDESLEDYGCHLNLIRRITGFILEIEHIVPRKLEIKDMFALEEENEVD